jgi:hypothetical protein
MSGTERVNTALSGSGRVDDIRAHPQGEIHWVTKLNITENVRKFRESAIKSARPTIPERIGR